MNQGFKALIGLSFLFMMFSGVAAQDLPDLDLSDFETVEDEDEIDVNTVIFDFDEATRLVDYDFNTENGTRLVFYSDTVRRVELYDVNGFTEKGNEELPINQIRLSSGYTEVLMDTTSNRGDRTLFMMVGDNYRILSNSRTSEFIGDPTGTEFIIGVIGGGIAQIVFIFFIIKRKKRKMNKRPQRMI